MRTAQMQAIIDQLKELQARRYGDPTDITRVKSLEAQLDVMCEDAGYKPVGDWGRWQKRNHLGHIQDSILYPRKAHEVAKLQRKPHVAMLRKAQKAIAKETDNWREMVRDEVQREFDLLDKEYDRNRERLRTGDLTARQGGCVRRWWKLQRVRIVQRKRWQHYIAFGTWTGTPHHEYLGPPPLEVTLDDIQY